MNTSITCPSCGNQFEPTDAIRDEIQKELRNKMDDWRKKKEDEFRQKETQLQQQQQQMELMKERQEEEMKRRLAEEKKIMEETISSQLKKNIAGEYDQQLQHFQKLISEKDEKLKAVQKVELEALELKSKLMQQEQEMEVKLKRSILEEREKLQEVIKKEQEERFKAHDQEYQMKLKELEKQLEDQRKLAEEMRRKAEQGSMQLQGEVQELALEALLKHSFPFDIISEVGKGVRGADCIQTIRNNFGQECGNIIYESKRTKDFSQDWIEKLKSDARVLGADVAVIVTQAMPKDMDCFGEKDGVWICSFGEVKALASVLRDLILKVFNATKSQENKGDKMQMLYTYLTSHEFSDQWKAIREGFMSMRLSIQKERDQMEKMWKTREKQLDKVLLNAAHVKGSIEGIAGMEHVDLNLTTTEEATLMIEE
jgi:hypothetical protein